LVIYSFLSSRYSERLRAGRPGDRIPVGARFSAPVQTGPGAHPASCTMGTWSFLGVESGRGMTLTPHPLLVPRSKNRVALYLYSPYGPSWPVKRVKSTYLSQYVLILNPCFKNGLQEKGGKMSWRMLRCVLILKSLRYRAYTDRSTKLPTCNITYVCVLSTQWRPIYRHRNMLTTAATASLRALIGWSFKRSLSVFSEIYLFLAQQSSVGQGLLIHEVSWSHTTHHSRNDFSGECSARRRDRYLTIHNTHDIHAPRWDSNPQSQQASGGRPKP
jgi:hypothetical protein